MWFHRRAPMATFFERPLTGHVPNPAAAVQVLSRSQNVLRAFRNVMLTVLYSTLTWYTEWKHRLIDHRQYNALDLVKPSVIFTNTHFITESSRSLTPDVVQIGDTSDITCTDTEGNYENDEFTLLSINKVNVINLKLFDLSLFLQYKINHNSLKI